MLTDRILVVIDSTSNGAVQEMDRLKKSTKEADTSVSALGRSLKTGLVAGAAALAGAGLVSFLSDSATAFAENAKRAGELATATGSSIGTVSRLQAALADNGISAENSATLLTKFTTQAGKSKGLLDSLGVSLKQNADGTTDYANGLVQAVDAIDRIGDSSQRNQAYVSLFGREGAAAFQELRASGVSLAEALERVSATRVLSDADRLRAQEYDDAIDGLNASLEGLQNSLGRNLVPLLTLTAGALTAGLEAAGEIEAPVYAAAAAFVALNYAVRSGALASGISTVATALTGLGAIGPGIAALGASAAPIAAVVAALVALNSVLKDSANAEAFITDSDNLQGSLGEQAAALQETQSAWTRFLRLGVGREMAEITKNSREAALASLASADATEVERAAAQGLLDVLGDGSLKQQQANLNTKEGQAAQQAYADSLSASAAALNKASDAQKTLQDLIAGGVTSGEAFNSALQDAGRAAEDAARNQEILNASLAAYRGVTDQAIESTGAYYDALYAAEAAQRRVTDAVKAYNEQPTADNLASLIAASRAAADAAVVQWQAAKTRLGEYVSESELAAQRVSSLRVQLAAPGFPPGAADQLQLEVASITAAAAREAGFLIPIGFDATDIGTSLATIEDRLADPSLSPEVRTQLLLDQESLTSVQDNIANLGVGAATQVKVDADTTQAESAITGLTGNKSSTLTVTLAGADEARGALDSLDDWRDTRINVSLVGAEAVRSTLDSLDDWRETRITVSLVGAADVRSTLDALDDWRTVRITVETAGAAAAAAIINGAVPGSAPAPINMFRVSIDGRELRSYIRAEMAAARPRPVEVLP